MGKRVRRSGHGRGATPTPPELDNASDELKELGQLPAFDSINLIELVTFNWLLETKHLND